MKTEEWSFDGYKKWMREIHEDFCLKQDDDLMMLFCGLERSGKTTNGLFWGCELDPDFISKNVCFLNKEYMNLQVSTMGKRMGEIEKEVFLENNRYNIDVEKLYGAQSHMKAGSVVIYDEAGTQMSSQRSLSADVVDQQDILIINGWLNLTHILNVPKPRSIHFYPREERCKLMLWHHKEYDRLTNTKKFHVYGYDRIRYVSMMHENNWNKYFTHTSLLTKKFPPTFHVELPDLNQYIKPEILSDYKSVKMMYSIAKAQGILNSPNGATKDIKTIAQEIVDSGKKMAVDDIAAKYSLGIGAARKVRAEVKQALPLPARITI